MLVQVDARSSRRRRRPFEEVAAELKRELATDERAKRSRDACTTRSRTSAPAARRSPRSRKKLSLTPRAIEAVDRSGRDPRRQAGRRPAAGRRRAVGGVRAPTSASRTSRCSCRAMAATSGTRSPASRRRASARSTRSRTRSRRAGATTRSRRGCKAKADRDARQAQGRRVVRRGCRGRRAEGRMAARHQARQPPPGIAAGDASTAMFRTAEGRSRQRRRRHARPSASCSASPRSRCRRSIAEVGRSQAHRRGAAPARSPRTCSRNTSRGCKAMLGVTINQKRAATRSLGAAAAHAN